jgi:hypothetical protein
MEKKRDLFVEAKGNWLKECEICNAGLCATIDDLIDKTGYSLNSVCDMMARNSDDLYEGPQLKARYMYHTSKAGRKSTRDHKSEIDKYRATLKGQIGLNTPIEYEIHANVIELTRKITNTIIEIQKVRNFLGNRILDKEEFEGFLLCIESLFFQVRALFSYFDLVVDGEKIRPWNDEDEAALKKAALEDRT